MNRRITLVSVLIVAAGAAVWVYSTLPEPAPEPTIEFHPERDRTPPPKVEVVGAASHSFGTLLQGEKGTHSWEFKNVGAGTLEVWVESTTCSCTVATLKPQSKGPVGKVRKDIDKLTIAPGQTAPIEVDWDARRVGRFAQAATMATNDPEKPTVVLSVLGMVLAPVEVKPNDSISLPDAPSEEARRTTVDVVANDRPEFKLTRVTTSRPDLIVAEAQPIPAVELAAMKAKAGYRLTVEVRPGMPTGSFSEELRVETDHPTKPSIRVTLAGKTLGPITVVPSRVGMPSVSSVAGGSQELELIVRGNPETNIEVAAKSEKLRVAIRRDAKPDAPGRYRLTVTVPPGTAPGLVDEPILLKTDHPKVKELRIPVSIFVSSRS